MSDCVGTVTEDRFSRVAAHMIPVEMSIEHNRRFGIFKLVFKI